MLEELRIQNFAIIDRLELAFTSGFNVITGETGAGKSIIIDAVELLLGGKADSASVRAHADKAVIEGVFTLDAASRSRILPLLAAEDLIDPEDPDAHDITLSREIRRSGRSSARVNGVTVNLEILREIGETLVDIHGQSAHLSLFKPRAHLDLLDRYADLLEVRDGLARVVERLDGVRAEINRLQSDKDELERRAERLRYEVAEIDAAKLEPDEEDDLLAERNRLANSEQLATLAAQATVLLSGGDGSDSGDVPGAVDLLMELALVMGKLARIDPDMEDEQTLADEMSANAQELALTLAGYADDMEFEPGRLDEVEERIELIKTLKRRYKVDDIAGILAYADRARDELDGLENSEERLNDLRQQEDAMLHHIGDLCLRISRARAKAGEALGKRIVRELKDLRMEKTRFEVVMTQTEAADGAFAEGQRYAFDATGMDRVEFMMSANPGEPLRPLARVASGGEAARIMLALKRVLSQADETPILIFDEIDQGIGGRIGAVVGEKLWSLSDAHQVMVVTHLPQLAGYGDRHFRVLKRVEGNTTRTQVMPLADEDARVNELAEMLGAQGDAGLQSARDILVAARQRKDAIRPPTVQKDLL